MLETSGNPRIFVPQKLSGTERHFAFRAARSFPKGWESILEKGMTSTCETEASCIFGIVPA